VFGKTEAEERALVLELMNLPPHFRLLPDALELGSWYTDIGWAAMLMSRGVWYPHPYTLDIVQRPVEVKQAYTLKYMERLVGMLNGKEAIYIKFGIGGQTGLDIRGKLDDFLLSRFYPRMDDYHKALELLIGHYIEAKEMGLRHFRDAKHIDAAGQQTISPQEAVNA
jgi:hypothetical protein